MRIKSFVSRHSRKLAALASCMAAAALLAACGGGGKSGAELDAEARLQAKSFVAYTRPDTYESNVQPDILVPMRDGFNLTCDLYRPGANGVPAQGRFPSLLINFQAYGRKQAKPGDLTDFAKKGYAVLWCNTRGAQGTGGGSPAPHSIAPVDMFSPQEARDGYDVVEWMAAQNWSTGKVGMIGVSYGGIMALSVAGQMPPHLATIVPIMGVQDQYQWAYPGGIRDVRGGNVLPVIAGCSFVTGEPTCSPRMTATVLAHPNFDDYWAARRVDLASIKVPILSVQGLADFMMAYYDDRNAVIGDRSNFATVIGPWPHGTPEQTSPEVKNMYLAWFDRWVADMPNVPEAPKATVKGQQGQDWDGFAAWPPKSSEPQTFYLTNGGLQQNAPSGGTLQYVIDASGQTAGLTLSTTFTTATTLAGPTEVSLPLSFTAPDANITVNIFARRNGQLINLGWAGYKKASHLESHATPSPRVPGQTYLYKLRVPSKFYAFQPGDSMVFSVVSSDKNVASDSPAGTVTVSLGQDAYIRAPMIASP